MLSMRITGGKYCNRKVLIPTGELEIRPAMDRMRESVFSIIGDFNYGTTLGYMFNGAFGNKSNIDQTILNMMLLLILALGLIPVFKMRYWNTGALGQALIGNACASLVIFYGGPAINNNVLTLILALLAAIIGGGIWGGIPGIFKAKINANETLFTLMMNYIATQIVLIVKEVMKNGQQSLPPFSTGKLSPILGTQYGWAIIITFIVALFMWIYMKFSKHGYELEVLGDSFNTAKYAGIDTNKVIIRTAILSGAICAICGFLFTASNATIDTTSDGGYGFTAIIVTWSSHFSILGMIIISFIITFFKMGADAVKNKASEKMNDFATYIAVGIFLLLLIGCEFFLNYKFAPTSKYAKIQEQKKKKLYEKNPKFWNTVEVVKLNVKNFFDKISKFFEKIKETIENAIWFVFEKISSIFSRKGEK